MASSILNWMTLVWEKLSKIGHWELIPRAYHLIFAHVMGIQGLYTLLTGQISFPYLIFGVTLVYGSAIGIAAGAHRLWSHRSYKATFPLRVLLMLLQTLAGQGSIYYWVRDHRLHHKYSETDGDPHNAKRGIFFTHIGWAMVREHPEVTHKEKTINFSDLHNDPVVSFQHKYMWPLDLFIYHALPILIPYYFWVPSLYTCVCLNYFRFILSYNVSSLGNSVAHTWIRKPYEKSIGPADVTWLSLVIVGEGWHNFHHVFPWDYRSTDVGLYSYNLATMFIDLMAKIGWAYDLKTVPDHVIRRRAARTGDGSHTFSAADDDDNNKPTTLDGEFTSENENAMQNKSVIATVNPDFGNSNESKTGKYQDVNKNILECPSGKSIDKLDVGDIEPAPWGWGDIDISQEDVHDTIISHAVKQE